MKDYSVMRGGVGRKRGYGLRNIKKKFRKKEKFVHQSKLFTRASLNFEQLLMKQSHDLETISP
jgi:hypothetical protein